MAGIDLMTIFPHFVLVLGFDQSFHHSPTHINNLANHKHHQNQLSDERSSNNNTHTLFQPLPSTTLVILYSLTTSQHHHHHTNTQLFPLYQRPVSPHTQLINHIATSNCTLNTTIQLHRTPLPLPHQSHNTIPPQQNPLHSLSVLSHPVIHFISSSKSNNVDAIHSPLVMTIFHFDFDQSTFPYQVHVAIYQYA